MSEMFVVAHISDLHFNGSEHHRSRVESVLHYINSRAEGDRRAAHHADLVDRGTAAEYDEAFETIHSPLPTVITIGNHDDREHYNDRFRHDPSLAHANSSLTVNGVQLLLVDSSIPGRAGGYIDDDDLDWLEDQLHDAEPGTPALVAFHHPPVTVHMSYMDTIRQTGEERLAELSEIATRISSRSCAATSIPPPSPLLRGSPPCVAPGVSSTLNLPFEGSGVLNEGQPPGIAFHLIGDDNRIVTHFRAVMD